MNEYLVVDAPIYQHELHLTFASDSRDYVDGAAQACDLEDGRTSTRRPSGTSVVVAAHAGLVTEHDANVTLIDSCAQRG